MSRCVAPAVGAAGRTLSVLLRVRGVGLGAAAPDEDAPDGVGLGTAPDGLGNGAVDGDGKGGREEESELKESCLTVASEEDDDDDEDEGLLSPDPSPDDCVSNGRPVSDSDPRDRRGGTAGGE